MIFYYLSLSSHILHQNLILLSSRTLHLMLPTLMSCLLTTAYILPTLCLVVTRGPFSLRLSTHSIKQDLKNLTTSSQPRA